MHTSAYISCRIHHNGGYDGDIYITNKDSTSRPVSEKAEIVYSDEHLISFFKAHRKFKPEKIFLTNIKPEGKDDKRIEVLFSDIEAYVEDVLKDKIQNKMDSIKQSTETLEEVVKILYGE